MIFSISRSSTSFSCAAVISPFSRLARASLTGAVRRMEPTWSARNGGFVRWVIVLLPKWGLVGVCHSTAEFVRPLRRFACVACGFDSAAEGKIMRGGIAQPVGGGQGFQDVVGPDMAEEGSDVARDQTQDRSRDPAAAGKAHQSRHPGRTHQADLDREIDPAGAQLLQPAENGVWIEAELAGDVDLQPLRLGRGDFRIER